MACKRILILIALFLWCAFNGCATGTRRWGYVDYRGTVRIPPVYSRAESFSEGLAAVNAAPENYTAEWDYINAAGQAVIKTAYDAVGPFSEGLAPVCRKVSAGILAIYNQACMQVGFINRAGGFVIEPQFTIAALTTTGMTLVVWSPVDTLNYYDVFKYGGMAQFHGGIAVVPELEAGIALKKKFINIYGKPLSKDAYIGAGYFSQGLAPVNTGMMNGLGMEYWGYIDQKGKMAIKPVYKDAKVFSEGLACVRDGWYYGYIDAKGNTVIGFKYRDANSFSGGLAAVSENGSEWDFIDKAGNYVTRAKYLKVIGGFTEGMAGVKTGFYWGFIDTGGKTVIPARFIDIRWFSGGVAAVKENDLWGYIDKKGAYVIKPQFYGAKDFSEKLAPVLVQIKDKDER